MFASFSWVTELKVSLKMDEEYELCSRGFCRVDVNLNTGAEGNDIYLWYKKENYEPITKVQMSFNSNMVHGLLLTGYTKVPRNLNTGAAGDDLFLWYCKWPTEYDPCIRDVDITVDAEFEAQKFKQNWERVVCDLNRGTHGNRIHMWVKREKQTYICDVTATNSYDSDTEYFRKGFTRMDENTNRGTGGNEVFVWYRQTTDPSRALTNVDVSTNDREYKELQEKGFSPVNVDLSEGTGGEPVHLWFKKEESANPIKAITLLVNMDVMEAYEKAGVTVIKKNLNSGNNSHTAFLCVHQ